MKQSPNHPAVRAWRETHPISEQQLKLMYRPYLIGLSVSLTALFLIVWTAPIITFYGHPIPFILALPALASVSHFIGKCLEVYDIEMKHNK
jgi:hypothetical protein